MRFVNLFAAVSFLVLAGCEHFGQKPDIDECSLQPDMETLFCVPTDTTKPEYSRPIHVGDIVVSPEHYAVAKKWAHEMLRKCAERCKE